MPRISFLFGSGISLSAKLPNVDTITDKLLTEYDYNNANYDFSQKKVEFYQKFLQKLAYYSIALKLNFTYEDLYYITKSIEDNLSNKKFGNFFITYFLDSIKYDLPNLIDKKTLQTEFYDIDASFFQFITGLNWYIKNFVADKLKAIENLEAVNNFVKMLQQEKNYKYDIFTLNHDILLETSLKKNHEISNTGFGDENKFSISNFADSVSRFNIFKLHGSIDWNRKRDINEKDYIFTMNPVNPADGHLDPTPHYVIGTFNKYEIYSYGIFYDLFREFRSRLSKTNLLIICGYGFRDEGVNSILLEWIINNSANKLYIFHKNKKSLIGNSNMFTGWDWESEQIIFNSKYFEDIEWNDIQKILNNKNMSKK